jgi:hypothetical protein
MKKVRVLFAADDFDVLCRSYMFYFQLNLSPFDTQNSTSMPRLN